VTAARVNEFVLDTHGCRISLTVLLFGRHHHAVANARFIQVRQPLAGEIVFVVTPINETGFDKKWEYDFDVSNVAASISIELVSGPIRSNPGLRTQSFKSPSLWD
jgi:hypothetical protein